MDSISNLCLGPQAAMIRDNIETGMMMRIAMKSFTHCKSLKLVKREEDLGTQDIRIGIWDHMSQIRIKIKICAQMSQIRIKIKICAQMSQIWIWIRIRCLDSPRRPGLLSQCLLEV